MFKTLFAAFKQGDSLDQAFSLLLEMLDHGQWMFIRANEVLRGVASADEVQDSLYRRDQSINELERSIRRKILRHLVINPGEDVPACLALMSVAKDAERIGDYCKNVFEVGRFYKEGFHVAEYHNALEEVRVDTRDLFKVVSDAFRRSDEVVAKQAINTAHSIRRRCDAVIERLLGDDTETQTHEAVAYSLLARHYKRVAGHLENISTAVLGQLDELDFRPE
jgi:phosphate transport system protein